ncbi:hypothetical protein BD626DRAFT_501082, partial [Schizophyllum amplum]
MDYIYFVRAQRSGIRIQPWATPALNPTLDDYNSHLRTQIDLLPNTLAHTGPPQRDDDARDNTAQPNGVQLFAPFARGYSPALDEAVGLPMEEFVSFVDGLNLAIVASPPS